MKKKFNVTGTCIPEKHYMVDIDGKLQQIFSMIEDGQYFTINRPRQYGKTTTLFLLMKRLFATDEYLPLRISFEGLGTESYSCQKRFLEGFSLLLRKFFQFNHLPELLAFLACTEQQSSLDTFEQLNLFITELCLKFDKKIVLMIDEVDKSANNQLFLDFLALLRSKYQARNEGQDVTFHSVILTGVHDIKSLKLKRHPDEKFSYNSPWNIAADFMVDLSFQPLEIATMLHSYVQSEQVAMDVPAVAGQLYYYTSGYPFLVSRLCKIIDEHLMNSPQWREQDVEEAVNRILREGNTNFESLIKNLETYPDVCKTVYDLIIEGEERAFNFNNPVIALGILHGIFKKEGERLKINNRIYELLIYDYMSSKLETSLNAGSYNFRENFIDEHDNLDLEQVLVKFQEFMRCEYSRKDAEFLERNGRLLFLAFLKPIINGKGFDFKEVQISEEKRLDVVVTWLRQKYVIELKIWRGEAAHQKGILQLVDYLDRRHLQTGYLLIFDFRTSKQKKWAREWLKAFGKDIFLVMV
ncbi:MAG: AAA family ATPase [Gammaproteobacteria bacterium]|nr:AAA family ATPase [Gammaproteobacteria bacterium]